jgi:Asp-tRNA(Asn)/Glu-tRNA(Gln) amidotransferase A subunit family amidase
MYDGFPIGLQLVCQRQMEAKLMKVAAVVDGLVKVGH